MEIKFRNIVLLASFSLSILPVLGQSFVKYVKYDTNNINHNSICETCKKVSRDTFYCKQYPVIEDSVTVNIYVRAKKSIFVHKSPFYDEYAVFIKNEGIIRRVIVERLPIESDWRKDYKQNSNCKKIIW